MNLLIEALHFAAVCWVINMSLNFLHPLKKAGYLSFDVPFDFNKNFFDQRRVFGNTTTWLGLVVALVVGTAITASGMDITAILKSFTVFFGHAIGSFIKRRARYNEGKFLPFVDHGDYLFLTSIVFVGFGLVPFSVALLGILLTLVLHPLACLIGYELGIREHKF